MVKNCSQILRIPDLYLFFSCFSSCQVIRYLRYKLTKCQVDKMPIGPNLKLKKWQFLQHEVWSTCHFVNLSICQPFQQYC